MKTAEIEKIISLISNPEEEGKLRIFLQEEYKRSLLQENNSELVSIRYTSL